MLVLNNHDADVKNSGTGEAIPCVEQAYHATPKKPVEAWTGGSL